AIGPDGAVFEELFLPDGNGFLERVDGMAAGFKSGFAVWRADGDEHAGFANFEAAEPMRHGNTVDGEERMQRSGNFLHFFQGHRLVCFVFEIQRRATVRVIADAAVEGDDGAIMGKADVAGERAGRNGAADKLNEVWIGRRRHDSLTAANRRKESDLVAWLEDSGPGSKFLIARGDDGRAEGGDLREIPRETVEKVVDCFPITDVDGPLGDADDVLKLAEE